MPGNHRTVDLEQAHLQRPYPTPEVDRHKEEGARLTGLVFVVAGILLKVLAAWDAGWIGG